MLLRFPSLAILVVASVAVAASARTWKDNTGRFTVEAEFVELRDGQVHLKKIDGTVIAVPIKRLGEADQAWLSEHAVRPPAAEESTASEPSKSTVVPAAPDDMRAEDLQPNERRPDVPSEEAIPDETTLPVTASDGNVLRHSPVADRPAMSDLWWPLMIGLPVVLVTLIIFLAEARWLMVMRERSPSTAPRGCGWIILMLGGWLVFIGTGIWGYRNELISLAAATFPVTLPADLKTHPPDGIWTLPADLKTHPPDGIWNRQTGADIPFPKMLRCKEGRYSFSDVVVSVDGVEHRVPDRALVAPIMSDPSVVESVSVRATLMPDAVPELSSHRHEHVEVSIQATVNYEHDESAESEEVSTTQTLYVMTAEEHSQYERWQLGETARNKEPPRIEWIVGLCGVGLLLMAGRLIAVVTAFVKGRRGDTSRIERSKKRRISSKGLKYFECDVPPGDGLCSDNACPCDDVAIPRGTGYLYIEAGLVDFRAEYPKLEDARRAKRDQADRFRGAFGAATMIVRLGPILVCEEGARRRNLDLDVAGADARHWWETGQVPLRATPKAGEGTGARSIGGGAGADTGFLKSIKVTSHCIAALNNKNAGIVIIRASTVQEFLKSKTDYSGSPERAAAIAAAQLGLLACRGSMSMEEFTKASVAMTRTPNLFDVEQHQSATEILDKVPDGWDVPVYRVFFA